MAARGLVSRLQVSLAEPPHISVILMDRRIDKVPQRNGFMRLLAYDLTPDGTASNQRVLVDAGMRIAANALRCNSWVM
jgi:hypothetical protein